MPDLERKNGITGVPFGRTELSIGASGRIFLRCFTQGWSRGPWFSSDARKVWFSCFYWKCFLLGQFLIDFLEFQNGKAMVGFGRTDLSIGANGTTCCALLHRDGPVGPGVQGMPENSFLS